MNLFARFGVFLAVTLATFVPVPAFAHAAEDAFALLLPTDIYIPAGVGTFAVTALLLMFMSESSGKRLRSTITLTHSPAPDWTVSVASIVSTLVFFCLLYIGWTGPNDPLSNLLPLMIWSTLWAGIVGIHIFIGDLWRWINPWSGFCWASVGNTTKPFFLLPKALGIWPAVMFFIGFSALSIIDPAYTDPERLAGLAAGYWLLTFIGMVIFGQKQWADQSEFFSVLFGLLSHVSSLRLYPGVQAGLPGWSAPNLLTETRIAVPIFCILMLGTGSFDAVSETFWWLAKIGVNPLDFEGRSTIFWQSIGGIVLSNTILLFAFWLIAWLGCALAAQFGQSDIFPLKNVFTALAFSTIPIFLGFHFAHFLTTFLVWGQYTVRALNDPLAMGSNILGLEDFRVRVGFLAHMESVQLIWLVQGAAIVMSHIIAVIIAHSALQKAYPNAKQALWAELPAALFLVGYTWFGLWLLAAPRGA